jgi:hypothetical protein
MSTPIRKMTLPEDLSFIKKIIEMFLNNKMTEAEQTCRKEQSEDKRLYVQCASALMRSMRALMSFETDVCNDCNCSYTIFTLSQDILEAQGMVQETLSLANVNRLSMSWSSRLASFAFDASLSNARQMSIDQLHAELVYAECLLQKAIMGLYVVSARPDLFLNPFSSVSSGDWMSFLREA